MSTPQYVRHISGQGEKWKIAGEGPKTWAIDETHGLLDSFICGFPKSEYVLCEPPEAQWVDVTKEIRVRYQGTLKAHPGLDQGEFVSHETNDIAKLICGGQYRLEKLQLRRADNTPQWGFVIEKRQP